MSRRELSCRKQSTPRLCCYFGFSIYHPKDPETSNVRTLQTWRCLRPKFKFQQTNMKLWQQPKLYFKLVTARNYVLCAPQTATGGKTRERAAGVSIYTNSYIGDDRVLRFGHGLVRENTLSQMDRKHSGKKASSDSVTQVTGMAESMRFNRSELRSFSREYLILNPHLSF